MALGKKAGRHNRAKREASTAAGMGKPAGYGKEKPVKVTKKAAVKKTPAKTTAKASVKKKAAKKPTQSFGSAFSEARKAGKKSFMWNGKSYHTRTKEDEQKAQNKVAKSAKKKAPAVSAKRKTAKRRDDLAKKRKLSGMRVKAKAEKDIAEYKPKKPAAKKKSGQSITVAKGTIDRS